MTTTSNQDLIGRDGLNDLDAILAMTNTDVDAAVHAITDNAAEIVLSGAGSVIGVRPGTSTTQLTTLEDSLTTNQATGVLRIVDNRDYTTSNDLTNAGVIQLGGGTLDANSSGDYAVNVNGNWRNNGGTFAARSGTVTLTGGDQAVYGSTTFYNLTKTDIADDTDVALTFETGSTQVITGSLLINGVDEDDRVVLDNTGTATRFNLNVVNYSPTLSYLVVSDSEALGNDITANNSTDLANTDSGEGSPMWIFPGAFTGPKRGAIIMVD